MDIYIKAKNGLNRASHKLSKTTTLNLRRGKGKLTDKQEIEDLLASEVYRRGEVSIDTNKTPMEIVNAYLDGDIPDTLTTEILEALPDEAVLKIAPKAKTRDRKNPAVIRKELRKTPVTTEIQMILNEYEETEEKEDALDRALESGEIIRAGAWYKDKAEEELTTQKRHEALQYAIDKEF